MHHQDGSQKCNCPHHKMPAVFMIVFGLVFLLEALDMLSHSMVSMTWPVIVILAGLSKIFSSRCHCCKGCACSKE